MRGRLRTAAGAAAALAAWVAMSAAGAAASASGTFSDTGGLTPLAQRAIAAVTSLGLMAPQAPGAFGPYLPVSRAEAVEGVAQVAGLAPATSGPASYSDVPVGDPAFGAVQAADAAGWMAGWAPAQGLFGPTGPMTRSALAVLAANALGYAASSAGVGSDAALLRARVPDVNTTGPYLDYVLEALFTGVVPPFDAGRYAGNLAVNREELAVTLYRMYELFDVPAACTVTSQAGVVTPGQADALSVTVTDRLGRPLPAAFATRYPPAYAVTPATGATVSSGGEFVATTPGTFGVAVGLAGPLLPSPVACTTQVSVTAPPDWPLIVNAQEVATGVQLTWRPPPGGAPNGYQVLIEQVGGPGGLQAVTNAGGQPPAGATTTTVTGLALDQQYVFEVKANGEGTSPPSNAVRWGAMAQSLSVSAFTPATNTQSGSITLAVTFDNLMSASPSDAPPSAFVVLDVTLSQPPYPVGSVVASGDTLYLTIPLAPGSRVASTDSFGLLSSPQLLDAAGAPALADLGIPPPMGVSQ
jgi:hypothetical protein